MTGRSFDVSRRAILKSSLWSTALAALPGFTTIAAEAVVDTTAGKVRGVRSNNVNIYRGIPYGASIAGANRFMPPRKVEPDGRPRCVSERPFIAAGCAGPGRDRRGSPRLVR